MDSLKNLSAMGSLKDFYDSMYLSLLEIDKKAIAAATGLVLSGTFAVYVTRICLSYRFFKNQGIETPEYSFIYGNTKEMKENQSEVVYEWAKKYGTTFGYYDGHLPVLVTSDLDIIQEVFIKQYNNFSGRKRSPLETDDNNSTKSLIKAVKGRWKRMRVIMNPTFSSSKLKEMGPLMIKCIDRLNEQLCKNEAVEINFSDYLKRFTMDTIWNCAFGMDIDMQNQKENLYFTNSEAIFKMTYKPNFFQIASFLFPEMNAILIPLFYLSDRVQTILFGKDTNASIWISREIGQLLKRREHENIKKRDYMQLLLDAQAAGSQGSNTDHLDLKDLSGVHIQKKLSEDEVKANLVTFMLAGYETTSTALQYSTFILATHQEEQQKLRDEIDMFYAGPEAKTPDTENVKDLPYLENFIKEVTRMYPIARSIRRCMHETTIKGIYIKPEMLVRADHLTIHYDPDLWGPTDPHTFDPTRHEVKRNPLAYLAFGAGPRNCIGMKFALTEMKLALVNLIQNFEILPSKNTPKKLELVEGIVRSPRYGVPAIFKKRN